MLSWLLSLDWYYFVAPAAFALGVLSLDAFGEDE